MRKIKAIMLGIILAGLVGCSTDDNNETGSSLVCKMPVKFDRSINGKQIFQICTEGSVPIKVEPGADLSEAEKLCVQQNSGQLYYNGCPDGSVLQCSSEGYTLYYYDDELKNLTCDDL